MYRRSPMRFGWSVKCNPTKRIGGNGTIANSSATAVADWQRSFWGHNSRIWHGASWKSVMDNNSNSNDDSGEAAWSPLWCCKGPEGICRNRRVVQPCVTVSAVWVPTVQRYKTLEAFDKHEQKSSGRRKYP
jgi:hypothetical protein